METSSVEAGPTRETMFMSEREAQEFARACGARWIGARLRYLDKTDSTNARALRLADLGWPEGTVVAAEEQTAGRGRLGRRWVCPPRAGLLVSVVLPHPEGVSPAWLTAAGALALVESVGEADGPELMIEWPNDIVAPDSEAPGGRRKVGGVLVETRDRGDTRTAALGAGLNVDVRPAEFPPELREAAGSLFSVFGASPQRREVLGRFLVALESRVERLRDLAEELRSRSFTLGREVEVPASTPGGDARLGRAVGFDDNMRLVVELPGGGTEAVAFRVQDGALGETA